MCILAAPLTILDMIGSSPAPAMKLSLRFKAGIYPVWSHSLVVSSEMVSSKKSKDSFLFLLAAEMNQADPIPPGAVASTPGLYGGVKKRS